MNPALIVLNPRQIPSCIQAIRALDIPTCWLTNMTEPAAAQAANRIIRGTTFTHYAVLSDDTQPTQAALDLVLGTAAEGHPAVTGYCNLDENEQLDIVNLTQNTLPPPPPQASSYQFLTRGQAEKQHGPLIPTTFAGLALTTLTRELWLKHPLHVSANGGQMDYTLSHALAVHGTPIVAPNGAYVHHVKERWNTRDRHPLKQLLVGIQPEAVTWTNLPAKAAA
jgi:hypothetical protein